MGENGSVSKERRGGVVDVGCDFALKTADGEEIIVRSCDNFFLCLRGWEIMSREQLSES